MHFLRNWPTPGKERIHADFGEILVVFEKGCQLAKFSVVVGYGEHETNSRLPELEYSIRQLCHSLFAVMVWHSASIGKGLKKI